MIKQAVIDTLEQGLELLQNLSQADYEAKLPVVYNASIGGHFRHVLEHFTMLLESYAEGFVNYDLRSRNTEIENNIEIARKATHQVIAKWKTLDDELYQQELLTQGKLSAKIDESMQVKSSFGRETAYSIAHAQHHYAIIGIMCKLLERPTADGFGIAPSTVAYMKKQAVANA